LSSLFYFSFASASLTAAFWFASVSVISDGPSSSK